MAGFGGGQCEGRGREVPAQWSGTGFLLHEMSVEKEKSPPHIENYKPFHVNNLEIKEERKSYYAGLISSVTRK